MYSYFPGGYQMPQKTEVIKVNGRGGADAFSMAPNCSALLLDITAPIVWLKTTDGGGYPSLTPYSITPYEPEPAVDMTELLDRIKRLEEQIHGEQSDSTGNGQQASN